MSQRALLLVNPQSRRGEAARRQVIEHLEQQGLEWVEESGEDPLKFPDFIRRYHREIDLVIIGGGDGSVSAAVPGLLDTNLPLGILPLGTANNLARTLQIPPSPPEACRVIAEGRIQRIDLGWVNGHYFFNIASLGLSAEINRRVSKRLKRRWGVLAYIVTGLQVIWQVRPFDADIQWNNHSIRVKTLQITVGNGRYYGSGLVIAEDATIDDERLDLHSLEIQHWWEMLPLIPSAVRGKSIMGQGVRTIEAKEFHLYTATPKAINTDGERTTQTPAHFRVLPKALSVFCPSVSV
ncbi:MAG TPA: lipid kinase [Coleofasciculaceae cyanobacterium]